MVDFIGKFFFSHLVMLLASCDMPIMFILTHFFIIAVYSTCFYVLIALFDYSHSMLTSFHYMIAYPILSMYTLIVAHFICHDLVDYFG